MSDKSTALAQPTSAWNLKPANLGEAMKYAEMVANSGMVPEHYAGKPQAVLVACETGSHLGFSALESCQSIAVINNMPTIWGDALPSLAMRHPKFEYIDESFNADLMVATCKIKRQGMPEQTRTFSWADAERAKLTTKDTYQKYPQRMLQMRARAWSIRDVFPDALRGTRVAEEVRDHVENIVPTDAQVEAAQQADADERKSGMGALDAALDAATTDQVEDADFVEIGDDTVDTETGEVVTDEPLEDPALADWKAKMDEASDYTELERIGLELNALEDGELKTALRRYYQSHPIYQATKEHSDADSQGEARG